MTRCQCGSSSSPALSVCLHDDRQSRSSWIVHRVSDAAAAPHQLNRASATGTALRSHHRLCPARCRPWSVRARTRRRNRPQDQQISRRLRCPAAGWLDTTSAPVKERCPGPVPPRPRREVRPARWGGSRQCSGRAGCGHFARYRAASMSVRMDVIRPVKSSIGRAGPRLSRSFSTVSMSPNGLLAQPRSSSSGTTKQLPPLAVVPIFMRCAHCAGVFRTSTSWTGEPGSSYRRCAWCHRLTKIPDYSTPSSPSPRSSSSSGLGAASG